MYELAQTYIRFDFNASTEFKEALEDYLLYKGKLYVDEFYNRDMLEGKIFFQVELIEGSLKSRLHVLGKVAVGVLATYGSIRAGMDYFVDDAKKLTEHIVSDIKQEQSIDPNQIGRVERRLGVPGKMKRLLNDIDYVKNNRNNLSPNQQSEILERISNQYEDLIILLDGQDANVFQQAINSEDLPTEVRSNITRSSDGTSNKTKLPYDDQILTIPRLVGLKEVEIQLVSEDEIFPKRSLPPPK